MSRDLFSPAVKPTGPHTSHNAPETSAQAAEKVRPALPSIRARVLSFAQARGSEGFIDEELIALAEDERQGDRSFRPRRTGLTDENLILDSGRRKKNESGSDCVVWIHRDFVPAAPPVTMRKVSQDAPAKSRGKDYADRLETWARQMHLEGRTAFAQGLRDAAATMRELSR